MYSEKGADMNKVNKDILERERYLYSPSGIILNESIDEDKLEIGWKNEMLSANKYIYRYIYIYILNPQYLYLVRLSKMN